MNAAVSRTHLPGEVATALGISVDTVGRYAREGLIPFDKTPKGHRRYNVEEVRAALASEIAPTTRLVASAKAQGTRLVAGPEVSVSPQSRLREDLMATRTMERSESPEEQGLEGRKPDSAFDEVLGHSRRVLVASGR